MIHRRAALSLLAGAVASGAMAQPQAEGGHDVIFADVSMNGRTGAFLVDTGAPGTILDSAFADAIGAVPGEGLTLRGAGGLGIVAGHVLDNLTMQAKGGPKMQLDPSAVDLGPLARIMHRPIHGILGGDYLAILIVEFDYRSGSVRFLDPAQTRPPPGAFPLSIRSTPYIKAAATLGDRRITAAFQIDTGSNTPVELYAPFANRAFPPMRGTAVASAGLAGESHKRLAYLDALEVAGLRLAPVLTNFADTLRPDDAGPDYAGIIGGPVFAGRVVVIDYARSRLWMR